MQPSQPTTPQPEQAPIQPGVELPTPAMEKAPSAPVGEPASAPVPATTPPLVANPAAPSTPVPAAATPPTPGAAAPATADDVDVIEKEWVDAAQKVVEKNANDPHAEEEGFEDLQVDYLKKRYGKDIKKPSE